MNTISNKKFQCNQVNTVTFSMWFYFDVIIFSMLIIIIIILCVKRHRTFSFHPP